MQSKRITCVEDAYPTDNLLTYQKIAEHLYVANAGFQVLATGMIEEEKEAVAGIYSGKDVFDDINQQIMMISTQESNERMENLP